MRSSRWIILALGVGLASPVGATVVAVDTFTEGADTAIDSHISDVPGANPSWDMAGSGSQPVVVAADDNVRSATDSDRFARHTATANSDQMDISARVKVDVAFVNREQGVNGRIPSGENGSANCYSAYGVSDTSNIDYALQKIVSSTVTALGNYAANNSSGVFYTLLLQIRTATKKLYIDGVERISSADESLSGNNFGGIRIQRNSADTRIDDFQLASSRRRWLLSAWRDSLDVLTPSVHADDGRTVEWYVSPICGTGRVDPARPDAEVVPRHPCVVDRLDLQNWVLQSELANRMWIRVLDTPAAHQTRTTERVADAALPIALRQHIADRGLARIDRR